MALRLLNTLPLTCTSQVRTRQNFNDLIQKNSSVSIPLFSVDVIRFVALEESVAPLA